MQSLNDTRLYIAEKRPNAPSQLQYVSVVCITDAERKTKFVTKKRA